MPTPPLDALSRDWLARVHRPPAGAVHAALVAAEPDLAATGAAGLAQLVAYLSEPPPGAAIPHWRVTAALIRQLRYDELVGLTLLVALRPGIVALGRRLDWGAGGPWPDQQAFVAELLSTTWHVLASVAGTTLEFPERTVLRRVGQRLAALRASARRRHERERPVAVFEPDEQWTGHRGADGWATLESAAPKLRAVEPGADLRLCTLSTLDALGAALGEVPESVLATRDVAIVYAHRVLGYSLREIAARSAQATTTVRLRCRRAEAVLCAN